MSRYPYLFTVINLVLLMVVVAAMLFGWRPDMMTGLAAIVLMIVVLDVALIAVLWRRRRE